MRTPALRNSDHRSPDHPIAPQYERSNVNLDEAFDPPSIKIRNAMTELHHKVKNALDEARTLILCAQVLLGFQFRAFFEQRFETLPPATRFVEVVGLAFLLIATVLLFMPAAFHRIVEGGEDSERLHKFATSVMCWALLPFSIGFGIDSFVAGETILGRAAGICAGAGVTLLSLFFWYGLQIRARKLELGDTQMKEEESEQKLNTKIEQVLTEIRMVLPGVQALLGFQMATTMMQSFEKLPDSSKQIHFAGLLLIILSAIFLMTPPAYHRLVNRGENTERFYRFAGEMLLAAMVSLPLGIAAGVFVVMRKFTESLEWSIAFALLTLFTAWGLWFGITLARKSKDASRQRHRLSEAQASA